MTADGRYSVCRMNVGAEIHYVAYLRGKRAAKRDEPHVAGVELGSAVVPRPATRQLERDDPKLKGAIRAMQRKCLEHAGLT